jgi:hypothetical protein
MISEIETSPPILKPADIVNNWEDWVHQPVARDTFPSPTYTDSETDALIEFSQAFRVFCIASKPWPESHSTLVTKDYWKPFVAAAKRTLIILDKRGKLPED